MTSYVLTIAMFVLCVAVCETIKYELPNVFDLSLTLKMKVKDFEDLNELVHISCQGSCMQKKALLGPAFCLQYIIVHFVINECTYVCSNGRLA